MKTVVHGEDIPERGHRFTIRVNMRGASSIFNPATDTEPHDYADSGWVSDSPPQVVRAHSLRDALQRALDIPFEDWMTDAEHYDDPTGEQRQDQVDAAFEMGKTMPSTVGSAWWFRYAEKRTREDHWPDYVTDCLRAIARGLKEQEDADLEAMRRL